MLKEAKHDPKIAEFLKRKIESAKWFIESIHQRQNTITRIATEIPVLRESPEYRAAERRRDNTCATALSAA